MSGFLGIEHFTPPWDVFFLPLFNLLVLLYNLPFIDFALAIVLFTILIRTILAPLFVRQIRSSKEMQRMAPLVREVQRKHRGNRQKVSEETMALYREHGVNPASGCLPVLLQLPILFALYQTLIRASGVVSFNPNDQQRQPLDEWVETAGLERLGNNTFLIPPDGPCNAPPDFASLVPLNCQLIEPLKLGEVVDTTSAWLLNLDLARVDHVFGFPVFGEFVLSGLAVIAAILQFVQVRMTTPPPNPDDPTSNVTSTMTYTFPLLTIVWGGIFPSGLILYWIVYTAYLIVQQYLIMGWGNLFPLFGWRPTFVPAPETGIIPTPKRREERADASDAVPQPTNPRPPGDRNRGPQRPARRRGGGKRRGRRR